MPKDSRILTVPTKTEPINVYLSYIWTRLFSHAWSKDVELMEVNLTANKNVSESRYINMCISCGLRV